MGEQEINLIVGEMRTGFSSVKSDIQISRDERREQIASLHGRLNEHGERIRALEVSHAENMGKCGNGSGFLGAIQFPRMKAVGLSAVVIAIGVCYAIAKTCKWL